MAHIPGTTDGFRSHFRHKPRTVNNCTTIRKQLAKVETSCLTECYGNNATFMGIVEITEVFPFYFQVIHEIVYRVRPRDVTPEKEKN